MQNTAFTVLAAGIALTLFVAMLVLIELGRRLGRRQFAKYGQESRSGVGVVDGAVFALLSLLIGFTFSGAAARYDQRRDLVGKESSTLSTVWDQIDVLPPALQPPVRDALRAYVDSLLQYSQPIELAHATQQPLPIARARTALWLDAVAACTTQDGEKARMLLLPALNQSFDAVETEYLARQLHPPSIIFIMLGITALAGAVFVGFGLSQASRRNWPYSIGVAAAISVAVFVIIELEYPRAGLIRLRSMDRALVELRATLR